MNMKKILLDVKPFQETLHENMCGPASLKIVLDFYEINKSEKELADLIGVVPGVGADDESIKKSAEALGFKAEIKNNSGFEDIEKWLDIGVPVIVDWFTRGRNDYSESETADGHYSVVIGLDEEFIYLQDPEIGGIRKFEREKFLAVWFDFKGKYIKPEELIIRQIIAIYK